MLHKAFKRTKQVVTAFDLFSTTELLRYKENPEFKSANGGLCSLAVIVGFTIIFTQTILNTFSKSSITSQTTLFEQTEPSYYSTKDSPFLFALGVSGFNLNNQTLKYFNIQLYQYTSVKGNKTIVAQKLSGCNRSDWSNVDPSLGDDYDTIGLSSFLCLPPNTTFSFLGKYTSNIFEYIKISVKECSVQPGDNRTCATSAFIDSKMNKNPLSFNYYFVNTIINPDNSQYLGFYMEDRNYFTFTKTMGTSANIFISSYTIDTDENLWPWQEIKEEVGGIVYQPTQRYVFTPTVTPNTTTEYVSLYIRKSSLSLQITRSFKKYDDTLSYIGGLFSTFMVCLFMMMKYNQYSYQVEIASKIYKYKKNKPIQTDKFNIISCAAYCVYCILDFIGCTPSWNIMKQFDAVREEMGKQLDLKLMLRKISFLQDCVNYIFEDYELQCLHLKGKMTLTQAEVIRKRFSSRKQLLKLKKKFDKSIEQTDSISIEDNKDIINMSNQQVFDISQINQQKINTSNNQNKATNNGGSNTEIIENPPQFEEKSDSSQSEQENEKKGDQQVLADYVESINQLKEEAAKGNQRCMKIYGNLDKVIKNIPDTVKISEAYRTKEVLNETQAKMDFKEKNHDFTFLNNIQFTD